MQDYNYLFSNTFEITIELSCCKYPPEEKLAHEWRRNKISMVKYLQSVHMGVKGIVRDRNNKTVEGAFVCVEGNDKAVLTTQQGEYWRLLLPGAYLVYAKAPSGEYSQFQHIDIVVDRVLRLDLIIDQPNIIPSSQTTTSRSSTIRSNTDSNVISSSTNHTSTHIISSRNTQFTTCAPSSAMSKKHWTILIVIYHFVVCISVI